METASLAGFGLAAWDPDGFVTRWTAQAVRLTGRPAIDAIGKQVRELLPGAESSAAGHWTPLEAAAPEPLELLRLSAPGLPSPGALLRAAGPDPARSQAQELARLRATLAVKREVTAAAGDQEAALRLMASQVLDLFEFADGATVALGDGPDLFVAAAAGTTSPALGTRLNAAGTLSGKVLASGVPAASPNTALDPRVDREACAALGVASLLITPLTASGRVLGVLTVCSGRVHGFDDADEQHLALLASGLASALRQAEDASRNALLLAERTDALAALETSEQRFRLTFDNSPLGVCLISLRASSFGHYLQANPAMCAITGYSADELASMTFRDLMYADDADAAALLIDEIMAGQLDSVAAERRYRHHDGHLVWVAVRIAVVRDEDGRALYLVNQVEDVTEQRITRAQIEQQARVLDLIPAAVIVRRLDGEILWWNAGAESLYGWPASMARGRTTHELLATGTAAVAGLNEALEREGRWDGELRHLTAGGRYVTVTSRQVIHHGYGNTSTAVLEINADVTAERAAERALAESEQRFRAQFTFSAVGQVVRGLDGVYLDVNPAYAAMLGRTREELIGSTGQSLVRPGNLSLGQTAAAELYARDKDYVTLDGRLQHADGHYVDVEATMSAVRDADGRPRYLIGVVSDVSARKAAEAARDQAAAALAERNTDLEAANQLKLDLIGMLGHDIGNPLTSILGYIETAADWESLDDAHRARVFEVIGRQANRINDITQEVLAMVRIDAGAMHARREPLSARGEIDAALAAVGAEELRVEGPDVTVLANPGHLQQILVNLLSNASKYGGGATAVRIAAGATTATITLEDGGAGVPESFREQLFERLTRAGRDASSVRGTGLGLYIVRGLAEANHGDVRYEPNPAGGSRFVVELESSDAASGRTRER